MGADELIEECAEVNHGIAQILGTRFAAAVPDDNLPGRTIVVEHRGMVDG
jgi:hypothetical protein